MVPVLCPFLENMDQLISFFILADYDHVPKISLDPFPIFHQQDIIEKFDGKNHHKNEEEIEP